MREILPICFFIQRGAKFKNFSNFNRNVLTVRVMVQVNASYFRLATLFFLAISRYYIIARELIRRMQLKLACQELWLQSYFKNLIFAKICIFVSRATITREVSAVIDNKEQIKVTKFNLLSFLLLLFYFIVSVKIYRQEYIDKDYVVTCC